MPVLRAIMAVLLPLLLLPAVNAQEQKPIPVNESNYAEAEVDLAF